MLARTLQVAVACSLLSGCATTLTPGRPLPEAPPEVTPDPPALDDGVASNGDAAGAERLRFFDQHEDGLHSIFLVPTAVDQAVTVGPLARSRIFVGALFATQRVGPRRVASVGLVFRSVGGGLGAGMSVSPWVVVRVDGEVVLQKLLVHGGLYRSRRGPWGPEETIMLRVRPEVVERMADGADVEVNLGDLARFRLDSTHRADLVDFLDRIPDGTRFGTQREVGASAVWRAQ